MARRVGGRPARRRPRHRPAPRRTGGRRRRPPRPLVGAPAPAAARRAAHGLLRHAGCAPPGMTSDLAPTATAWMDRWYDAGAGLLWNPPGSYDELAAPQTVHLVPQSG